MASSHFPILTLALVTELYLGYSVAINFCRLSRRIHLGEHITNHMQIKTFRREDNFFASTFLEVFFS